MKHDRSSEIETVGDFSKRRTLGETWLQPMSMLIREDLGVAFHFHLHRRQEILGCSSDYMNDHTAKSWSLTAVRKFLACF